MDYRRCKSLMRSIFLSSSARATSRALFQSSTETRRHRVRASCSIPGIGTPPPHGVIIKASTDKDSGDRR